MSQISDPLRIAVAVEGLTDAVVLEAILTKLLSDSDFEFQTLQPDYSIAFGPSFPNTGQGWSGVYRWSRQAAMEGNGSVSGCSVLSNHDVLIVHLDADVAGFSYGDASIRDAPCNDLPCVKNCPPPSETTNALRSVMLNWLGENVCPPRVVLCTPSKSIETWLLAAICPDNNVVRRDNWECNTNPDAQPSTLPRAKRFKKNVHDYRARKDKIVRGWTDVSYRLSEASRFEREFLNAVD